MRASGTEDPVFRQPWEAQIFAITMALLDRGVFTPAEWTAALARERRAAGDQDAGESSYRTWLAALERIAADKGLANEQTLSRCRDAWNRAAQRTPHGTPIELRPEDPRDHLPG